MIGGVKHLTSAVCHDERTIANSTFLVKQIVLSLSAFPQRGARSILEPRLSFVGIRGQEDSQM